MNTWLERWDRRYTERVQLLVDVLPALAQEPRFALKGGTAINLFEHDLPRLSVEIAALQVVMGEKWVSFRRLDEFVTPQDADAAGLQTDQQNCRPLPERRIKPPSLKPSHCRAARQAARQAHRTPVPAPPRDGRGCRPWPCGPAACG